MLRLMLIKCKQLNKDKVLITCDKENYRIFNENMVRGIRYYGIC